VELEDGDRKDVGAPELGLKQRKGDKVNLAPSQSKSVQVSPGQSKSVQVSLPKLPRQDTLLSRNSEYAWNLLRNNVLENGWKI